MTADLASVGSTPPVTCLPTASISEAAREMAERSVGDVVSADDLYRVESEVLSDLDRVLGRARRGR